MEQGVGRTGAQTMGNFRRRRFRWNGEQTMVMEPLLIEQAWRGVTACVRGWFHFRFVVPLFQINDKFRGGGGVPCVFSLVIILDRHVIDVSVFCDGA